MLRISPELRSRFKHYYTTATAYGKRIGWWKVSLVGGLLLGVLVTLVFDRDAALPEVVATAPRAVETRSIAELSGNSSPLPVVGIVSSQSQADIRTESSGQITRLYKKLGDSVRAGEIIAEMENGRERAAVLQSEGAFEAAQAALSKITRGARDEQVAILESTVGSAKTAEASARASAVNTLLSAFSSVDEAVRRKTDPMFDDPASNAPQILVVSTDSQLESESESGRVTMARILTRQDALSETLSVEADLEAEILRTETEVRSVKNYLDKIVGVLNKAVPDQSLSATEIATFKSDANAARTSISATLASLSAARESLAAKEAASEVAQKNLEQGSVSDASDVASANASVKQAQGALAAARANLEKTIVRAPISGTINSLPIEQGDFVSAFSPAATIANNNALEIVAYITESDARELSVGSSARIDGSFEGIITRIAPAVDPATKKLEVRVGIVGDVSLVNGQAVTVELTRAAAPTDTNRPITIPISALKIGTSAVVVFTVADNFTLVPHEVILGTLLGEYVVIEAGVTPDMQIVLDARGLKAGQTVSVK